MAAYDIQKHFSNIRVQTARRRRDPFAEAFSDSDEDERKSRIEKARAAKPPTKKPNASHVQESDDDDFLNLPKAKQKDRRPSPAPRVIDPLGRRGSLPGALPSTDHKKAAAVLAAGPLAYLDDSSDDEPVARPSRKDRNKSPAPRKASNDSAARSQTPRGDKLAPKEQSPKNIPIAPPKHTVASPFAGTVRSACPL